MLLSRLWYDVASPDKKGASHIMLPMPYIAGLFDAEGWIGTEKVCYRGNKERRSPVVTIANTNRDVMVQVLETLTANGVTSCIMVVQERNQKQYKKIYQIRCSGFKGVTRFCELVLPYSVSKTLLLVRVQEWCEYRKSLPYNTPQNEFDDMFVRKIGELSGIPTHKIGDIDVDSFLPFAGPWLAGYFDGDGNVNMYLRAPNPGHRNRVYTVRCSYGSVSKDTMEFIYRLLLRNGVKCGLRVQKRSERNPRYHDLYTVSIDGMPNIECFINLILPYSVIKKPQLQLAQQWIGYRKELAAENNGNKRAMTHTEIDRHYYDIMRELNRG